MKQLSELDISPTPWNLIPYGEFTETKYPIFGMIESNGENILNEGLARYADALIMKAAPKLYEALRELYLTSLEPVGGTREEREKQCKKYEEALDNARAALMEASGE